MKSEINIDELMRSQRSHAVIWIPCKKINASSFLAPTRLTLIGARLSLIFWPKLTQPAARSLCDSSATVNLLMMQLSYCNCGIRGVRRGGPRDGDVLTSELRSSLVFHSTQ